MENDLYQYQQPMNIKDRRGLLVLLVVEFCEAEDGKEREIQKHRIQKDKSGDTEPTDVFGK